MRSASAAPRWPGPGSTPPPAAAAPPPASHATCSSTGIHRIGRSIGSGRLLPMYRASALTISRLLRRKAKDLRVRNDVLRMPVMPLVVHKLPHILHHRRRLPATACTPPAAHAPSPARRTAPPHAAAPALTLRCSMSYRSHTSSTPAQRSLSIFWCTEVRRSTSRQHLRQHAIPQPQRRVAKPLQPQPLQQARIHQRAADDNLRPPWPNPRNRLALRIVHLRQPVRQLPNIGRIRRQRSHPLETLLRQRLLRRSSSCATCPLASASAAAVPDVAITSPTRGVPSFFSAVAAHGR